MTDNAGRMHSFFQFYDNSVKGGHEILCLDNIRKNDIFFYYNKNIICLRTMYANGGRFQR
jgi:hypothetical protein